jgi:hypothetical protein
MVRTALAIALVAATASLAPAAVNDDFNDNTRSPQWSLVADDAARLNVVEQNGRLEVISSGNGSATGDALYLSDGIAGFRMSTASSFEIAIRYSFTNFAPGSGTPPLGLVFGVGKDVAGFDSAAIGISYVGASPSYGVSHRTDDVQPALPDAFGPASATGTLVISYNAAGDDLAFAIEGGATLYTLNDTVNTVWDSGDLLVSFGARGSGLITASGDAYLDDFTVRSGSVVPEPAILSAVMLIGIGLLRRRA